MCRLLWNALNLFRPQKISPLVRLVGLISKTTKRKLDDCAGSLALFIIDNATLRRESVCSCVGVRLMWRERRIETEGKGGRERERSITRSISAVQRNQGEIGSASSEALHHQIFLQQLACVSVCCVLTETLWDCARHMKKKRKQRIQKDQWKWTRLFEQLTYQWIKNLEPVSLRAFIQNTKESVQGIL